MEKREKKIVNILSAGNIMLMAVIFFVMLAIFPFNKFTGYSVAGSSETTSTNEWTMYGRNLNHTFYYPESVNITNLTLISYYEVSGGIHSSPAVANQIIYFGDWANYFYAYNISNGVQLWNYSVSDVISSSPAVADNIVYFGSNDYSLYALNATNGSKIWSYATDGEILAPPVIANRVVYFGGIDAKIYALNATDGAFIWNYDVVSPIQSDSATTIVNDILYLGNTGTKFFALNATDGTHIWNYSFGTGTYSSAVYANDIIYTKKGTRFFALNATDGTHIWNHTLFNIATDTSSPAISNDILIFGESTDISALNATNGSHIWTCTSPTNNVLSSPVIANDVAFVGTSNNIIYAVNVTNGSELWESPRITGTTFSSIAIVNGSLYVGSSYDNKLYVFGQNTTASCTEILTCGSWTVCVDGHQTRDCLNHNTACNYWEVVEEQHCNEEHWGGITKSYPYLIASSSDSETQAIPQTIPEKPIEITINNPNLSLTSVEINVKVSSHGGGSFKIKELISDKIKIPREFSTGKSYKLFEINIIGINKTNVANATLNFKIEKSWLIKNNFSLFQQEGSNNLLNLTGFGGIKMYRDEYGNNSWMSLNTTLIKQDEKYYYFSALSPGFSIFDVLFEAYGCKPNNLRCNGNAVELCVEGTTWRGIELCDYQCKNNKCVEQFFNFNRLYFFVVTGMISATFVVAVFLGIRLRKKK